MRFVAILMLVFGLVSKPPTAAALRVDASAYDPDATGIFWRIGPQITTSPIGVRPANLEYVPAGTRQWSFHINAQHRYTSFDLRFSTDRDK